MRYRGWNYEKTLLLQSKDSVDRRGEIVDAFVTVPAECSGNLENDVRVVLKPDWNRIGDELACQVYAIERHGDVASFRVVFAVDVPAHGSRRIGVLYDNPAATRPVVQTTFDVSGEGCGLAVDARDYAVACDPRSGQIARAVVKVRRVENTFLKEITPVGSIQPGISVDFPAADGGFRTARASDWRGPRIVSKVHGPLFHSVTREAPLVPPDDAVFAEPPVLRLTYTFFADAPYILVDSRLSFPADTEVFGISMGVLQADSTKLSHYTFRPVSPSLKMTDVEEMGHLIIDPASVGDLPEGNVLSGFIPYDCAWHSFIHIYKGGWASQYAVTGINLRSTASVADGRPPARYRAATYLFRENGTIRWFRAPIYVKRRDRRENIVTVPAGSVYRETDALVFGHWNAEGWAQEIEALGKRLNTPLAVSAHPALPGRLEPADYGACFEYGQRRDAYLRAGVR
jgi:hypothetical protein